MSELYNRRLVSKMRATVSCTRCRSCDGEQKWTCKLIQPADRAVQEAHDCRSFLEQTDSLLEVSLADMEVFACVRWIEAMPWFSRATTE